MKKGLRVPDDKQLVGVIKKNSVSLEALDQLLTLADEWNKEDSFVPDYNDSTLVVYSPVFYGRMDSGFGCVGIAGGITSPLCFKSSERAIAFGNRYKYLYKKYLER